MTGIFRRFLAGSLRIFALAIAVLLAGYLISSAEEPRQKAIKDFSFENKSPAYAKGEGPKLRIHRSVSPYVERGAFDPFGILAQTDGFRLSFLDEPITFAILQDTDIFIIANAYTRDYRNYSTLDAPSVYTDEEISLIVEWVKNGGSLLVLADHSPFAGGTIRLASAFGFTYITGHALNKSSLSQRIDVHIDFSRGNSLLSDHPITNGSTGRKRISHFYGFGGQAIIPPPEAINLLVIPAYFEAMLGFVPADEFYSAPRMDVGGLSQGATLEFGKGRLVIMGETGGFTAQIIDGATGTGFEQPAADENKEFVLATLRWLARFMPGN